MPELKLKTLNNSGWESAGVKTPAFDIQAMKERTSRKPEWVHFGAGNIFRGFIAANHQHLLEAGKADTGIIAVETFDYEIIDKIYKPYDKLTLNVSASADGTLKKEITASVAEALKGDMEPGADTGRLKSVFGAPSLKMVSFTVTEKGYTISGTDGQLMPVVLKDLDAGPEKPSHLMCILTSLMLHRYKSGALPVALVSMDNCSHNGEKLMNTVLQVAEEWKIRGFLNQEFIEYLKNPKLVSFPWSMIDRITPRPSDDIKDDLELAGISGMAPVITSRNTYIAPFVNSEETKYLFIEDLFPNGRIELGDTEGMWFTDRETVNRIETMKVTTCLNPLHTAIAVTGCMFNYTLVSEAVKDAEIDRLIKRIGYDEGLPVVIDPGIISAKDFLDEVYFRRLRNPYIPDSPARIASDTSLKVGIRFGETIKAYHRNGKASESLIGIPLAIAAWLRYLMGTDDKGEPLEISVDPQKDYLVEILHGSESNEGHPDLRPVLSNAAIFGIDLYEAGIGDLTQKLFNEMNSGAGAVRKTLSSRLT